MNNQTKDLRINTLGKIVAGTDSGCFLRILDDSENTGGFLVLTSKDPSMKDASDDWVRDARDLAAYLDESGWTIEWLD